MGISAGEQGNVCILVSVRLGRRKVDVSWAPPPTSVEAGGGHVLPWSHFMSVVIAGYPQHVYWLASPFSEGFVGCEACKSECSPRHGETHVRRSLSSISCLSSFSRQLSAPQTHSLPFFSRQLWLSPLSEEFAGCKSVDTDVNEKCGVADVSPLKSRNSEQYGDGACGRQNIDQRGHIAGQIHGGGRSRGVVVC